MYIPLITINNQATLQPSIPAASLPDLGVGAKRPAKAELGRWHQVGETWSWVCGISYTMYMYIYIHIIYDMIWYDMIWYDICMYIYMIYMYMYVYVCKYIYMNISYSGVGSNGNWWGITLLYILYPYDDDFPSTATNYALSAVMD